MKGRVSRLGLAIDRKDWEAVALYLLLGATRVAGRWPPDAIEDVIEVLSGRDAQGKPAAEGWRRGDDKA